MPYTFDYKGLIEIDSSIAPEDKVMEIVLEAGADDFVVEDNTYIIYTSPAAFSAVKQALDEQLKIENYLSSEVNYFPNSEVNLPEDKVEQFEKFVELLEDDDDVQEVIHNAIY
ncbi:Probable transcriptional regulatory protein YebC [Chlamydia abortus]|nr:Probable transcriptional regulatory protein YebC [Chlamydia abortus]